VPARLSLLFDFSPERALNDARIREELAASDARAVVTALAQELARVPRLDRERFRAVANQVKAQTGQKGKALFHPIRLALTARAEGPELDLAIPAIDRGAELPPDSGIPTIVGCRERAAAFAGSLSRIANPESRIP
jgi:glutamyl/glutaminyl-tRNA synthetase